MSLLKFTVDSFQNFAARVGLGSGNQHDNSQYGFDFVSRDRLQLEAMYRSSWVVGQVVDVVAEDMTREGLLIRGFDDPRHVEAINQTLDRLEIWDKLCSTIKWGRLYGGCLAVMLIDGQRPETPLNINTIGKGSFKGLMVLDRWMVQPTLQDLVTEYGPHYGKPKYYDVITDAVGLCNQRIHHSRIIRIDGVDLPHWQSVAENLWGQSVIERLIDRLTIFDSATIGAGQLVYKAHLRTYKVDKLREVIAKGGQVYEALLKQINQIRQFQSNEGITLMDASDSFETHQYSFTGLDNILLQFGQQISGAVQIPLVRLFGQSPAGLNSTGESDLSNYYDNINQQQERRLRTPLQTLLRIICLSEIGQDIPTSFRFDFASLWQLDDEKKATIANTITTAVLSAVEQGIVTEQTALKELRQSSEITGVWSNISDDDIEQANDEPPAPNNEHTHDADWNEEDHPRADNGQFGNGGASGLRAASLTDENAVTITSSHAERMPANSLHTPTVREALKQLLVEKHGESNPVVNKATGHKMIFTTTNLKASLAKNGKDNEKERLLRSLYPALPELYQKSIPDDPHFEPNTKPEQKPGIAGYRNYLVHADVNGKKHLVRIGVDVPHPDKEGNAPRSGAYYFHKLEIE